MPIAFAAFIAALAYISFKSLRFAVRQVHDEALDEFMREIGATNVESIWFDGRRGVWNGRTFTVHFAQQEFSGEMVIVKMEGARVRKRVTGRDDDARRDALRSAWSEAMADSK